MDPIPCFVVSGCVLYDDDFECFLEFPSGKLTVVNELYGLCIEE